MFTLLGIAWALVTALCLWLLRGLWRAWKWMNRTDGATIQVMTVEQERFVEHARKRAWKELFQEEVA